MVLAFTKLSFNICHSKNIKDNYDETDKKLKENCRPIKLTRSFTTISPAGEHMMIWDWDWMEYQKDTFWSLKAIFIPP